MADWFDILKAADFAYFPSGENIFEDTYALANSNFHLQNPPKHTDVKEQQGSLHSLSDTTKPTTAMIQGIARQGKPKENPSPFGVPKGYDRSSAITNLSSLGSEYRMRNHMAGDRDYLEDDDAVWETNPHARELEELEGKKGWDLSHLDRMKNWLKRKQIGAKSKKWENEGRKQVISEADERIIPELINTNVHEVGHNVTQKEIDAAIDAEEGLTDKEKYNKKVLANEYAAFTMGEFSDPRLQYDEDGNPLDKEEHWKRVLQARDKKLQGHLMVD